MPPQRQPRLECLDAPDILQYVHKPPEPGQGLEGLQGNDDLGLVIRVRIEFGVLGMKPNRRLLVRMALDRKRRTAGQHLEKKRKLGTGGKGSRAKPGGGRLSNRRVKCKGLALPEMDDARKRRMGAKP